MNAVLIVDDEVPSRELIKMSLDWRAAGFERVLEARNGREALSLYERERPALVITDIQMPVMDGLGFIRAVREIDPRQKILILSCHESFSYAKQALRLGVLDYILKDSFTADSLLGSVRSAMGGGAAWEGDAPRGADLPADGAAGAERALRLALGEQAGDADASRVLADALNGRAYFACAIKDGDGARGASAPGFLFARSRGTLYALAFLAPTPSRAECMRERAALLTQLRRSLGGAPTVGVSRVAFGAHELQAVLGEAEQALQGAVFEGVGRDLYYDEAASKSGARELDRLDAGVARVRQALDERDDQALAREIERLYRKELKGMRQYNYLKHVNALLMGILTQTVAERGIAPRAVFDADVIALDMLEDLATVEEMCAWFTERFRRLTRSLAARYSPRLSRIIAYLDANYAGDVSLDSVAERFRIHKVYLAKVFKAETGVSVNEYIREKRIERAKALLAEPDARVGEVVDALGFHNAQTFYNLFKRTTGMSPSEYKELCALRRISTGTIEED